MFDDPGHDDVGAFDVETDFPAFRISHDDSHPLCLAFEREHLSAGRVATNMVSSSVATTRSEL